MARTDSEFVRALIDVPNSVDLTPYIQMATDIVDVIVKRDSGSVMASALLKHIESLLAAHYYAQLDPQHTSKTTGDASETYLSRDWWREAVRLDLTGTLAAMSSNNQQATVSYLGTRPRLQRKAWQRP